MIDGGGQARRSSLHGITGVADAVLVNAPAFGGWYLLQGKAGVISCATNIHALLFGGLSRRQGERGDIGVARIECSRDGGLAARPQQGLCWQQLKKSGRNPCIRCSLP